MWPGFIASIGLPKGLALITPADGADLSTRYRWIRIGQANPGSPGDSGEMKVDTLSGSGDGTRAENVTMTVFDGDFIPTGGKLVRIYATGTDPTEIWGIE
jgi:hypothetical protein